VTLEATLVLELDRLPPKLADLYEKIYQQMANSNISID
jgi:hypothetical protein